MPPCNVLRLGLLAKNLSSKFMRSLLPLPSYTRAEGEHEASHSISNFIGALSGRTTLPLSLNLYNYF